MVSMCTIHTPPPHHHHPPPADPVGGMIAGAAEVQYSPPRDEQGRLLRRNRQMNEYNEGDFTMEELRAYLKKAKNNKASGWDEVDMEQFKLMDHGNLTKVLEELNRWWRSGTVPEEKRRANVVSLYKKGDPLDPNNFRPISLLCSQYKKLQGCFRRD